MRLQNCNNFAPTATLPVTSGQSGTAQPSPQDSILLRWLQRLQFKMGQIELQSSAATQFFSA